MKKNNQIIKEMFWALLPIQIISAITSSLGGMVNGILIGNFLSPLSLVALGFVTPLNQLIGATSSIVGTGGRIVAGRNIGKGETEKIKETFATSLLILLFIGLVFTVSGLLLSRNIAVLLGADEATIEATAQYVRGLSFGFIPLLMVSPIMAFLQLVGMGAFTVIGTLLLVLFNLLFSSIAIFVLGGGIFEMGIASSLSQLLLLVILLYKTNKCDLLKIELNMARMDIVKTIVLLGSPAALANILYSTRNLLINSLALKVGGTVAVSALAIVFSFAGMFDGVNVAIGTVTTTLASVFVGENDNKSLKDLFKVSSIIGIVAAFIKIAILVLFGKQFIAVFGGKGDIAAAAYRLTVIYSFTMPVNILTIAYNSIFQAMGKVAYSNALYIFNAMLIPMGFCYGFYKIIGIDAVWWCYFTAEAVIVLLINIYTAIKNKCLPDLDAVFGFGKENMEREGYNITIRSIGEVIESSKAVIDFLKEKGIDNRRSYYSGLCVEEMAGNIVEHGFTKAKRNKKCSIDVFVSLNEDKIRLQIRDNAPAFDPRSRLSANQNDPCKNMGIRMVSKISRDISYQNYFGMNVFVANL